jgi:hypothetical protein
VTANPPPRRRLSALLVFLILALATGGVAAGSARAQTSREIAARTEKSVVPFMETMVNQYSDGTYGTFGDGTWSDLENPTCWPCADGGATTTVATLYVLADHPDRAWYNEAVDAINIAIKTRQQPNGGFTAPPVADGLGDTEGIDTAWFGVEFGTVYDLLAPDLPASTRTHWQGSLARAADYLETSGNAGWYANGNLNLAYTELFWLTWHATADPRFKVDYNQSWQFVGHPTNPIVSGNGWVTLRPASAATGEGGLGYFTESDGGPPGFDAEYSMIQLDVLARLYLLSGDPRALRAANMILDMELPRINRTTWMLNTSGGSRHPQAGRQVGWLTSAFAVLGFAGRSDLLGDVLPDLHAEETWYPQPGQADSPEFRRSMGNDVSVIALAAAEAEASGDLLSGRADTRTWLRSRP